MGRSSSVKTAVGFYLRRHRKWPHSPYKARWHRIFSEQQAMGSFKQAIAEPQHQHQSPNLLSSLVDSFSIYNCEPTRQAYHYLIKTLTKTSQLHQIALVLDHLQKVDNFETPEFILADVITTYGNANRLQDAIELFYKIPKFRCVPSAYSLNALISVLCGTREGLKMVPEILLKSQSLGIRIEESTFSVMITALCRIRRVGYAIEMFNYMMNDGFSFDPNIGSLLLSSLCQQKDVSKVEVLGFLEQLKNLGFCPGMIDYTNVIRFFVKRGLGKEALSVLNRMKMEGIKPDVVCYTMVLDCIVGNGEYSKADELFDELLVLGLVPDVFAYNVYINGLCKQGNVEAGIKMVSCMEELGCKPNLITFKMLLRSLCEVGMLDQAREVLREMQSKGIGLDAQTYRIMIDGLMRNCEIAEACEMLEQVLDKGLCEASETIDDVICGLCRRGLTGEALGLLEKMAGKNVSPGVRAWEAFLSSEFKLNLEESSLLNLMDGGEQTQ